MRKKLLPLALIMEKKLLPLALVSSFGILSLPVTAQAVTLDLNPLNQSVTVGETVSIDVQISGLGDMTTPSLQAFDLNINFDPTLLSFSSATFGDPTLGDLVGLPDPLNLGPVMGTDDSIPGVVAINEVSFAPADDFNVQPDSFILATLDFIAISPGTSNLDLDVLDLVDTALQPIPVMGIPGSTTVIVMARSVTTPEPGFDIFGLTLLLVLGGYSFAQRQK